MKKVMVMVLVGAGWIGMAIVRRMGYGMEIIIGDKNKDALPYERNPQTNRNYFSPSIYISLLLFFY